MSRILITSGPTRQHLDPVRYLTNGSSGRMGLALAQAALAAGHEVTIVSGPVEVEYPAACRVRWVISTEDMLQAAREEFQTCDGLIGAAAPCDYRPVRARDAKIQKDGQPLVLELVETPDIVATLGAEKGDRWVVGFALETDDQRFRAITKLERKRCDLMVLNGPQAMHAADNDVEVIDPAGQVVGQFRGRKEDVATAILKLIAQHLVRS